MYNKNKTYSIKIIFALIVFLNINLFAQRAIDNIISDSTLIATLAPINDEIVKIKSSFANGNEEEALKSLAKYFSEKMSDRFFFNWEKFDDRFNEYQKNFSANLRSHYKRAEEHMVLFTSDPKWEIPSKGKDGSEITAYKLRHLARQHKALDIAYVYFLNNEADEYKDYLVGQVNSLALNYSLGNYDKKGNAIFESFRAGYRVFNWLFVYNYLLASDKFTWRDQLDYVKTFYFHALELDRYANKFRYGNHHTKGLVAQTMISILFPEFNKSQYWLSRTLPLLTEHLMKEIKHDGFQFERSVHYHIGDIANFFYVYYLAKLNKVELPKDYHDRFEMMFESLVKLALPSKTLPVLQDDTDAPWAEFNQMSHPMTIGSILFKNPTYKYFSENKISSKLFWLFRDSDIEQFYEMKSQKPNYGSEVLEDNGYYVMRNGWEKNSQYLIISAGLSDKKPDHQHGDMLGLYAAANENIILPNYQCRYFLPDYSYFKNSFVKNVALVDSIPQGQKWKGNSGGSGFGKWKSLPEPQVINWQDGENYSFFIGSHNGYENLGINYSRMVLFIKDGFYIVKDEFDNTSKNKHLYQQVWQGNYSEENNNKLLRSTFQNGSGLDIYQLNDEKYSIAKSDARGKGSTVISSNSDKNFSFLTLLSPFKHFDNRLNINENNELEKFSIWKNYKNYFQNDEIEITANHILINKSTSIVFGISSLQLNTLNVSFTNGADILLRTTNNSVEIISINNSSQKMKFSSNVKLVINSKIELHEEFIIEAGKTIEIIK